MDLCPNHNGKRRLVTHSRWLLLKARKRLVSEVCRRLYRDSNRDIRRSILVAGVARSGTTWLADIIRSQIPCRLIWEPFNPHRVSAFSHFQDFPYRRPDDSDPELARYTHRVFQGRLRDAWTDRETDRVFFERRLIKEIRCNLCLGWLHNQYSSVPFVFIVRHPCAVVLSRMEANWGSENDLAAFMMQPDLVDDFLVDKMDSIRSAQTTEEKHAIVWCVQHLVPRRHFQECNFPVIFYENLCLEPDKEVDKVFKALNQPYQDSVFDGLNRPSRTASQHSAVISGDKTNRWRNKLSSEQIENVLAIVESFGLAHLYGSGTRPISETL